MLTHVCTTHSLAAGLEDIPPGECSMCGQVTVLSTWVGPICTTCGADFEAGIAWSIARARKQIMPRKDWAKRLGLRPETVSSYDWRPSKRYVEEAKRVIREHYGG